MIASILQKFNNRFQIETKLNNPMQGKNKRGQLPPFILQDIPKKFLLNTQEIAEHCTCFGDCLDTV